MNRTGLASETAEMLSDKRGVKALQRDIGRIRITDVRVDETAEERFGKPCGRYITLEGEPYGDDMAALLRRAIEQMLPQKGRLFVAGLGNTDIIFDSLGAKVAREIIPKKGRRYSLASLETNVAVKTGLDTSRLVRAAAREYGASCVIAVDSLACRAPKYIGRSVQISDAGITPGSGADERRMALNKKTIGIDVTVIGVPTVCELSSVTGREDQQGYMTTCTDIDILVRAWTDTIALAINSLVR